MLTLSLSDLRRDPHSELVELGRGGQSLACGRCFLGEPLTAGEPLSFRFVATVLIRDNSLL